MAFSSGRSYNWIKTKVMIFRRVEIRDRILIHKISTRIIVIIDLSHDPAGTIAEK